MDIVFIYLLIYVAALMEESEGTKSSFGCSGGHKHDQPSLGPRVWKMV